MLVGLKVVIKAMHPEMDWTWLAKACNRIQTRARQSYAKQPIARSCAEMDTLAQTYLARAAVGFVNSGSLKATIAFRDALMLALMIRRPLRISNFTALSLGTSIARAGTTWRIKIPGSETKNGDPIDVDIPPTLVPFLDLYVEKARMIFPGASGTSRLWLNKRGPNCHPNWIGPRIKQLAEALFDIALSPRDFRDIGATFLAYQLPEAPLLAASLLSHRHLSTTKRWYIQADNLRAAERVNCLLARRS